MNNLDNDTLLGKAPIPRAVAAMAIPSVISSLVTVVYNMADTFFVGQTGDALQVAAVSLTNPIFILLMAFANMFGMGGSAMISVALGESNHQSVKKISSFISQRLPPYCCVSPRPSCTCSARTQAHLSLPAATRFTSRSAHRSSSGRPPPASLCARKAQARRP